MNSNQNTRTNRDQEKEARAGVSPTTQAGAGRAGAAENVAATNRRLENEDDGPMTTPEDIEEKPMPGGQRSAAGRRSEQRTAADPSERSPSQENL
jgi:hypothetical protein